MSGEWCDRCGVMRADFHNMDDIPCEVVQEFTLEVRRFGPEHIWVTEWSGRNWYGDDSGLSVRPPEHQCTGWWSGGVTCVACGGQWVGAWCDCADRGALQCPSPLCGAMAGMPDPVAPSSEERA